MTDGCLYPQLTAKARASTLDESRIRTPFAGPAGAKRWLRAAEVTGRRGRAYGGGGFSAGGDTGLAGMLNTRTLAVWSERDSSPNRDGIPRTPPGEPTQDADAQDSLRGVLPDMALKQPRRRVDEGEEEHPVRLGEIHSPFDEH